MKIVLQCPSCFPCLMWVVNLPIRKGFFVFLQSQGFELRILLDKIAEIVFSGGAKCNQLC